MGDESTFDRPRVIHIRDVNFVDENVHWVESSSPEFATCAKVNALLTKVAMP